MGSWSGSPTQVSASLPGGSIQHLFQGCLKAYKAGGTPPGGQTQTEKQQRGGYTFLQLRTDCQGSGKVPDSPVKSSRASHLLLGCYQVLPESTAGRHSFPPRNEAVLKTQSHVPTGNFLHRELRQVHTRLLACWCGSAVSDPGPVHTN